jgi:outer membrane protein TolC
MAKKWRGGVKAEMKFLINLYASILVTLMAVNGAGAERLTLHQAVNTALKNSPDLKAFSWSVESQKNNTDAAMGKYYPTLNIEERFLRTDNPTLGFMAKLNQERFSQEDFQINRLNNPDGISDYQTLLTVEQPLFVPEVHLGFGMAKKELKAKEAEYDLEKERVALNVIKKFLEVQTAHEYVKAAQKSLDDALEHKRLASLRYDVGSVAYSDRLRTEVEIKSAEAQLVSAESGLEVSRRALGLALGRTEPVDVREAKIFLPLGELNSYLEASTNRKDIEALTLRHENARTGVKMEKSGFLPKIGVRGSYQMNDHNNPFSPEGESYMVMGLIKWNLFDASKFSKIEKAKADEKMIEERIFALKNRINFGVHDAFIRVKEREQNLNLSKAILAEAEEAIRMVRLRYENSLVPIVDLLDTQVMLNNARAGLVRAESAYTGSIADLYYQSGILLNALSKLHSGIGGNGDE